MTLDTVFILGGSGFIGSVLVSELMTAGYNVIVGDIAAPATDDVEYRFADVTDKSSLLTAIPENSVVVNLAAEHKDNVDPVQRYYDVNVEGMKNLCDVATEKNIERIIFTSSVAVYGEGQDIETSNERLAPVNHYGRSKLMAENFVLAWQKRSLGRFVAVHRPTVVFGPGNRGNVYNLFKQIADNRFVMVGSGLNRKSMTYVGNVVRRLRLSIENPKPVAIHNSVDKPDLTMNELVNHVKKILGKKRGLSSYRIPEIVGIGIGRLFDMLSVVAGKEFPISSIRIKKFCSDSVFTSSFEAHKYDRTDLLVAIEATLEQEFGNQG